MAISCRKVEAHWNYLLAIEGDLERLSRFIEFDERNFACFSIEISRILLASGAEVDVVCKQICKTLNPKSSAHNIHHYRDEILKTYPAIPDFEILLFRYGLSFKPWSNWATPNGVPYWWSAYNNIKHHRDAEYHQGNLHNALKAVGGLFIMVLYLYKEKAELGELVPAPRLIHVSEDHDNGSVFGNFGPGNAYNL
jgi:DNA modification methylase